MSFLSFPKGFIWGTSTAAYQIETAGDHDWKGYRSMDGSIFERCSEHDKHRLEDAALIANLSNGYRMSCDWSKLQTSPYGEFDSKIVAEYIAFLEELKSKNIHIMMVLHHFTHPRWFVEAGSWETGDNYKMWLDFVTKSVQTFGGYVDSWNTFNEPNVYVSNGYLMGNFPPFRIGKLRTARKVLKAMEKAHNEAYDIIKESYPNTIVGISHNTVKFAGEIFPGQILAKVFDYWFMEYCPKHFEKSDFTGLSYYARMPFRPFPIDNINQPGKLERLGKKSDMMWEYKPEEFYHIFYRYWNKYKKPIIITESGVCTDDPKFRIESIKEYLFWTHKAIQEGVDIRGYFHWSTFDNHEWNIGLKYRFGLASVNFETMERTVTEAGVFMKKIATDNGVEVEALP